MMRTVATVALLLAAAPLFAQGSTQQRLAPIETPKGQVTASVDLGAEFPQIGQLKGYVFTQTYTVVAPGTGKSWHSHAGFPEIVRILSGTMTDQRNGGPAKTYGPGSTLINAGGTQHMWANLGTEPVVFIATAIRGPQPQ